MVFRFSLFVVLVLVMSAGFVRAQDVPAAQPSPTPLTAPPPIRIITKDERAQIDQSGDPKQRVRVTMQLASARLTSAEQHTAHGNFDEASNEVGSYHALIEDALGFLSTMKRDSNKTRDLYKRLELALRSDGPRLTTMRRTTPLEYAVWIKKVEEFARQSRTEALNSFYGHTVVRDGEKSTNDKPKEVPTPTPKSDQP